MNNNLSEQIISSDIIIKALELYDKKKDEYNYILYKESYMDEHQNIYIDNIKFKYELLGYFDLTSKVWIWGWSICDNNVMNNMNTKQLLEYGVKLHANMFFFKNILVNSRIQIETQEQLDINLAIYNYLLKDRIKVIYQKDISDNLITYLIIL